MIPHYVLINKIIGGGKKYSKSRNHNHKSKSSSVFPKSKKFIPEEDPTILKYDKTKIKELFPETENMDKLQLSNIGEYSMSKPQVAEKISRIILKYFPETPTSKNNLILTEANSNMGGNTINFSRYFSKVLAVEIIPLHCDILRNNLKQYKHTKNVEVICADYLDKISQLEQDVVFFDPPWGGPDYKSSKHLDLYLNNIHMAEIINFLITNTVTKVVAMRVPRNFNFFNLFRKLLTEKINIHKVFNDAGYLSFYMVMIQEN